MSTATPDWCGHGAELARLAALAADRAYTISILTKEAKQDRAEIARLRTALAALVEAGEGVDLWARIEARAGNELASALLTALAAARVAREERR